MWTNGSDFFIEFPGSSSGRILHAGTVIGMQESSVLVQPKASLALEPGQDIRIFFERDREFMQQPARVEASLEDECLTLAIQPLGEAVSAESREYYRVSTVFADLSIDFGGETCQLTDISALGFSVLSQDQHARGDIVSATISHEGTSYRGEAQVQSVTDLGGTQRYGLVCASEKSSGATLQKGLQKVSMDVQRSQLKRRARA